MSQSQQNTRHLVRRSDDKVIAGVCSGLGAHFGLDPIIFRIAFILLALMGASGVLLYIAMWVIVPADDAPLDGRHRSRGLLRVLGMGLIVIASLWVLGIVFSILTGGFIGNFMHGGMGMFNVFNRFDGRVGIGPFETLIPAAIFVGIGVLLLRQPAEAEVLPPASTMEVAGGDRELAVTTPVPIVRRERSPLALLTVAAALTVVGIAAVLGNLDVYVLDVGQLTALGMLVLGLGLVASAWIGRARWLIFVGVMALPVVLVASLINFPPTGHVGSRYLSPTSQPLEDIEMMAGDVGIDLSSYTFPNGEEDLHVRLGAGSFSLTVPNDVYVDATIRAQLGEVQAFRTYDEGFDIDLHTVIGSPLADKRLNLVVDGGLASVHLNRYRFGNDPLRNNNGILVPPDPLGVNSDKNGGKKR
jgi:phage shock protein PspC (stress-responsive transcriptional regulator)